VKRLPGCAGVALAACIAAFTLVAAGPAAASRGRAVSITDSGFKPAVVRIKQWQVVTWTNDGKAKHGVVSDTGKTLQGAALDPGQAYANLFKKAGAFSYHDPVHPSLTGRVIVVAAPKPTVTGPTPPSGKKPKHFKTGVAIPLTSADSSSGGGTNWTGIGGALGGAALVVAAAVLLLRRRGSAG
jgi:plastocyanin